MEEVFLAALMTTASIGPIRQGCFCSRYLFWSGYKTRLSCLLGRKWNGVLLRAGTPKAGGGRVEMIYPWPCFPVFQVVLTGLK